MTVHIQGGGQKSPDRTSGSNCTTNETNDTFTTTRYSEPHDFGFDSKGSGSCFKENSWSYFTVSIKDASGKEIGHGESLWLGQNVPIDPYYVGCNKSPKPWVGLSCTKTSDLEVRIA